MKVPVNVYEERDLAVQRLVSTSCRELGDRSLSYCFYAHLPSLFLIRHTFTLSFLPT